MEGVFFKIYFDWCFCLVRVLVVVEVEVDFFDEDVLEG